MVKLASFCGQAVLPDRSIFIEQKLVENAKIEKLQMRHFEWFSNILIAILSQYFYILLVYYYVEYIANVQ